MAKYRKKPVVVEVIQYNSNAQFEELKSFVGESLFVDMKTTQKKDKKTLEKTNCLWLATVELKRLLSKSSI